MSQSSRQRGKLIRRLSKEAKRLNRIEASQQVAANLSLKPIAPDFAAKLAKSQGPARYDAKPASTSRERLKGGSYGVGFQGPRGYGTPTGLVSKQEGNGEKLAGGAPKATQAPFPVSGLKPASKRFAGDTQVGAADFGYDYATTVPRDRVKRRKGKGKWRTVDLNDGQ